jgi:hypothetical protein
MVYFLPMINLEHAPWLKKTGGHQMPFDPRPLLKRLETDSDTTEVWQELWEELHHQGDVGEASYAAVRFLVGSYRKRRVLHWNNYPIARSSNWHEISARTSIQTDVCNPKPGQFPIECYRVLLLVRALASRLPQNHSWRVCRSPLPPRGFFKKKKSTQKAAHERYSNCGFALMADSNAA